MSNSSKFMAFSENELMAFNESKFMATITNADYANATSIFCANRIECFEFFKANYKLSPDNCCCIVLDLNMWVAKHYILEVMDTGHIVGFKLNN